MTTGDRVREIRKQNGMNQTEFAKEIGVSTASVCYIENGKYHISRVIRRSLCHRFHINPEWLETGKGEQFVEPKSIMTEDMDWVLERNPAVMKVFTRAVSIFSDEDWRNINSFLERLMFTEKAEDI